jgi:hypothetical protein
MEQKTPTPLNILYDKPTEANRDRFCFAFSSDINEWIKSRQRRYDQKMNSIKAEKKSSL